MLFPLIVMSHTEIGIVLQPTIKPLLQNGII